VRSWLLKIAGGRHLPQPVIAAWVKRRTPVPKTPRIAVRAGCPKRGRGQECALRSLPGCDAPDGLAGTPLATPASVGPLGSGP